MTKDTQPSIRRRILRKIFWPPNFVRLVGHLLSGKRKLKVIDDAQLQLFAKIAPGGFLHYGYFDEPSVAAQDISFRQIQTAQHRYAELILDQVADVESPVLDSGCGMGGLLKLMTERGIPCTGLTPDQSQVAYISKQQPDVPLEETKFEDLDIGAHAHAYGTVIHSESLQYIELDQACKVVDAVLKPGGRWVVIDYFRLDDAFEKSGHRYDVFRSKVAEAGFKITHEHDVTENVLPTMAFAHLLGQRLAVPLADYAVHKVETKSPALNFILEDVVDDIREFPRKQIKIVDPDVFKRDKCYVLFTLERS